MSNTTKAPTEIEPVETPEATPEVTPEPAPEPEPEVTEPPEPEKTPEELQIAAMNAFYAKMAETKGEINTVNSLYDAETNSFQVLLEDGSTHEVKVAAA